MKRPASDALEGIPLVPVRAEDPPAGSPAGGGAGGARPNRPAPNADPAGAAREAAGQIAGFARHLPPAKRAEMLLWLDTLLGRQIDEAALEASKAEGDGLHPRHRLTRYHEFFVEHVPEGSRVLDLGSGTGAVGAALAARCKADVTGVDICERSVNLATAAAARRGLSKSLRFVLGDITRERTPGTFDVLVLSDVLGRLEDRPALLRRWVEWYRPTRVLLRGPAFERDWKTAYKQELGVDPRHTAHHRLEHTREQMEAELAAGGLAVRELVHRWGEYWVVAETAG